MKLIREITEKDITNKETYEEISYKIRKASRAVVFNKQNKIAILNVSNDNYHKLPGGGIERDEDIITALRRELIEEVGVEVDVLNELGMIIEYRDNFKQLQISYCYLCKVVGEYQETSFTEEEKDNGFILEWVSLNEAISILEKDNPEKYMGKFIRKRDLEFLKNVTVF
ncbi:ADP-ribose pyrophosphatase YjhB (NUDIX family) [Clostridium pascui]|uniref:NUDIX hydrolase n=1 Tax=Clostridium pascui TaxID=46609 RepID=UPI0019591B52|nr:NUDIX domain-containing protein [Clostridium pascui]MBM7869531.1 ADP-ribose pyrophosphatase YjhB (NUDIX family) [Clostridium pascui]